MHTLFPEGSVGHGWIGVVHIPNLLPSFLAVVEADGCSSALYTKLTVRNSVDLASISPLTLRSAFPLIPKNVAVLIDRWDDGAGVGDDAGVVIPIRRRPNNARKICA
jgi:hypothetical protein